MHLSRWFANCAVYNHFEYWIEAKEQVPAGEAVLCFYMPFPAEEVEIHVCAATCGHDYRARAADLIELTGTRLHSPLPNEWLEFQKATGLGGGLEAIAAALRKLPGPGQGFKPRALSCQAVVEGAHSQATLNGQVLAPSWDRRARWRNRWGFASRRMAAFTWMTHGSKSMDTFAHVDLAFPNGIPAGPIHVSLTLRKVYATTELPPQKAKAPFHYYSPQNEIQTRPHREWPYLRAGAIYVRTLFGGYPDLEFPVPNPFRPLEAENSMLLFLPETARTRDMEFVARGGFEGVIALPHRDPLKQENYTVGWQYPVLGTISKAGMSLAGAILLGLLAALSPLGQYIFRWMP